MASPAPLPREESTPATAWCIDPITKKKGYINIDLPVRMIGPGDSRVSVRAKFGEEIAPEAITRLEVYDPMREHRHRIYTNIDGMNPIVFVPHLDLIKTPPHVPIWVINHLEDPFHINLDLTLTEEVVIDKKSNGPLLVEVPSSMKRLVLRTGDSGPVTIHFPCNMHLEGTCPDDEGRMGTIILNVLKGRTMTMGGDIIFEVSSSPSPSPSGAP